MREYDLAHDAECWNEVNVISDSRRRPSARWQAFCRTDADAFL